MEKVCLLNGSLRGKKATSARLLDRIEARLAAGELRIERVAVQPGAREHYPPEVLAAVCDADVIIMAFPLFSYSLPGALTAFLEDLSLHARAGGPRGRRAKVFAIINCGFPDPRITREAVRVVKNFCARLGMSYRFSISLGSGPVTALTMRVPFLNRELKSAFARIVADIAGGDREEREDVLITPIIPKGALLRIKDLYERKSLSLRPQASRRMREKT